MSGDTSAIYNLACLYALTHRKEEALDTLKQALESHHNITWEELEAETDLESIRQEPAFATLVETYFPERKVNA